MQQAAKKALVQLAVLALAGVGLYIYWQYQTRPGAGGEPERVEIEVSGETTHLTRPMHNDGTVDYAEALNSRYGRGVRPAENLACDLFAIAGPMNFSRRLASQATERMGCQKAMTAEHIQSAEAFAATAAGRRALDGQAFDPHAWRNLTYTARSQPFTPDDQPLLAAWLEANEAQLARAAKAPTGKKHFFIPVIAEMPPYRLPEAVRPGREELYGLVNALLCRAMLAGATGEIDKAVDSLIGAMGWARGLQQSFVYEEVMRGQRMESIAAYPAIISLGASGKLSASQARRLAESLVSLPPRKLGLETLDVWQRLRALDIVQICAVESLREGVETFTDQVVLVKLQDAGTDYNQAMRRLNDWTDRLVRAGKIDQTRRRRRALQEIRDEFAAFRKNVNDIRYPGINRFAKVNTNDMLVIWLFQELSIRGFYSRAERAAFYESVSRTVLALARYKARNGRYPEALTDLVSDYLPALPSDMAVDEPLIYKPRRQGQAALLYSRGANGKDDGGKSSEMGPADDIAWPLK